MSDPDIDSDPNADGTAASERDTDDGLLDARSAAKGRARSAARNRLFDALVTDGKLFGVADPWTLFASGGLAVVAFVGLGGVELGEDEESLRLGAQVAGAGLDLLAGVGLRAVVGCL